MDQKMCTSCGCDEFHLDGCGNDLTLRCKECGATLDLKLDNEKAKELNEFAN